MLKRMTLAVILLGTLGAMLALAWQESSAPPEQMQREINALQASIGQLRYEIYDRQDEIEALRSEVMTLQTEVNDMKRERILSRLKQNLSQSW